MNAFRDTIPLAQTLENLKTGQYRPKHPFTLGDAQTIPGNMLSLDVDTVRVDWEALASEPSDRMYIDLAGKQVVRLQELMILELFNNINNKHWQRPIHFATTITPSLYMNLLETNFSLNGLTYQVVPGTPLNSGVNIEAAYDNMVNKFRWGGLEENPDIYLDETSRRMLSTYRLYFTHLVDALIGAGEKEKALAALDKVTSMIPPSAVAYGTDGLVFARAYYRLGEKEKAEALIADISDRVNRNLDWFARLNPVQLSNTYFDVMSNNINPMLLITSIYQQYDKGKYKILVDDLLQRAQTFYTQGAPYFGDALLKEITDGSVRGYYSTSADDTLHRATEEETMQKALNMMQQFSPRLLEQYQSTQ
jgi:tetratricopeptide (TPR) repeat protein